MILLILYELWTYGYEKFAEIGCITDVIGHIMLDQYFFVNR